MRRRRVVALSCAFAAIIGIGGAGAVGGLRLNLTPSAALGLWRIETLHRPIALGDLVFICPPSSEPFEIARDRGYLQRGLCAGGFAPLLKTVAALSGQCIEIGVSVIVDGRPIPSSDVRSVDGEGRALRHFTGGSVLPDHLFLHSSFASSYDSRYFGPIPTSGLLGVARPVLTFDP